MYPCPDHQDNEDRQGDDEGEVDGEVVVEAHVGEDVAKVNGVGRHEHARAEAGQVVGLNLGKVQACLDHLGEEKRVLEGFLNGEWLYIVLSVLKKSHHFRRISEWC